MPTDQELIYRELKTINQWLLCIWLTLLLAACQIIGLLKHAQHP